MPRQNPVHRPTIWECQKYAIRFAGTGRGKYPDVIKNTSFWPDVRVSEFRRDMRMDGSVTDPRLRLALLTAIAEVNADLYEFREKQRAQGYASGRRPG